MNKIVREHYPVEKLPEDLRADLGIAATVKVTIEPEAASQSKDNQARTFPGELLDRIRRLHASGAIRPVTTEEAVARIRALRDERDE